MVTGSLILKNTYTREVTKVVTVQGDEKDVTLVLQSTALRYMTNVRGVCVVLELDGACIARYGDEGQP